MFDFPNSFVCYINNIYIFSQAGDVLSDLQTAKHASDEVTKPNINHGTSHM